MDCLVFQQRVYLEVIDICAVWLNLKCVVWNACAYWWVIYHIMCSLLKYFEDNSRHSFHCFKHTLCVLSQALAFSKVLCASPGPWRVLRHFSIEYLVYSIYLLWASQGSEPSVLKVLRSAPYKQPPSRPLRPLQDDNNDGNYADMDTVFAEMMNKL